MEKTVDDLRGQLDEARDLVKETQKMQAENEKASKIDNKLAEKLDDLKKKQEKNVKTIESLVKERDMAEAKAKRMEKVLIDDVDSLNITIDEDKINSMSKVGFWEEVRNVCITRRRASTTYSQMHTYTNMGQTHKQNHNTIYTAEVRFIT